MLSVRARQAVVETVPNSGQKADSERKESESLSESGYEEAAETDAERHQETQKGKEERQAQVARGSKHCSQRTRKAISYNLSHLSNKTPARGKRESERRREGEGKRKRGRKGGKEREERGEGQKGGSQEVGT